MWTRTESAPAVNLNGSRRGQKQICQNVSGLLAGTVFRSRSLSKARRVPQRLAVRQRQTGSGSDDVPIRAVKEPSTIHLSKEVDDLESRTKTPVRPAIVRQAVPQQSPQLLQNKMVTHQLQPRDELTGMLLSEHINLETMVSDSVDGLPNMDSKDVEDIFKGVLTDESQVTQCACISNWGAKQPLPPQQHSMAPSSLNFNGMMTGPFGPAIVRALYLQPATARDGVSQQLQRRCPAVAVASSFALFLGMQFQSRVKTEQTTAFKKHTTKRKHNM